MSKTNAEKGLVKNITCYLTPIFPNEGAERDSDHGSIRYTKTSIQTPSQKILQSHDIVLKTKFKQ